MMRAFIVNPRAEYSCIGAVGACDLADLIGYFWPIEVMNPYHNVARFNRVHVLSVVSGQLRLTPNLPNHP